MRTALRSLPYLLLFGGLALGAYALWGLDGDTGVIADSGAMFRFLLGIVGLALVGYALWLWLRNEDRRRRRYRRRR